MGFWCLILTMSRGYENFFMPNSAEHEILIFLFKNIRIFQAQISLECYFPCS